MVTETGLRQIILLAEAERATNPALHNLLTELGIAQTPRPTFTVNGTEYFSFPEFGAWFAVEATKDGQKYLVCVAMNRDGSFSSLEEGCDVTVAWGYNAEDEQRFCDAMNKQFGTSYSPSDFAGR